MDKHLILVRIDSILSQCHTAVMIIERSPRRQSEIQSFCFALKKLIKQTLVQPVWQDFRSPVPELIVDVKWSLKKILVPAIERPNYPMICFALLDNVIPALQEIHEEVEAKDFLDSQRDKYEQF